MDIRLYSPAFQELLADDRLNELGPGQPNQAVNSLLKNLTVDNAFKPNQVQDVVMAGACLAGLWLHHDFLDEAHKISQDLASAEGSYWHGLVHRREPDFGNAKYWFHRVGRHPVFHFLSKEAAQLASQEPEPDAEFLRDQPDWDPYAFIDLCEAATLGKSQAALLCRQIQKREWELLFGFCYRGALGEKQFIPCPTSKEYP